MNATQNWILDDIKKLESQVKGESSLSDSVAELFAKVEKVRELPQTKKLSAKHILESVKC